MKTISTFLAVLLLSICSSAMAQWQWLDKDGRRVFSDRAPPSDILEKNILKRPNGMAKAPEPQAAAAPEGQASAPAKAPVVAGGDKELEAKKKQIEKQAADADAAKRKAEEDRVTKAKIENCARAKQAMDTINSGVRISTTNAAGERVVMDDAARAAERARVQSSIDSDCR